MHLYNYNSMLIDQEKLALALIDFDSRNNLIGSITAPPCMPKNFFKTVLACWLGSNFSLSSLTCYKESPYIYAGYYCILALEKELSLLDESSPLFKRLAACRCHFFSCYNEHYEWLKEDPKKLFLAFQLIIDNAMDDVSGLTWSQKRTMRRVKKTCSGELARVLGDKIEENMSVPTKAVSRVSNDGVSPGVFAGKIITANFKRYPFFYSMEWDKKDYAIQKILLPAQDGTIIDGLYAKKHLTSRIIVLAIIGHFQAEHHYLSGYITHFADLFGEDIVFINHRNYSFRSNKFAVSSNDFANDIVSFAEYFKKKNRNIVLYGMCGGGVHAILAAGLLRQKNISFKLIVDRFFCKYTNFLEFKTMKRLVDLDQRAANPFNNISINTFILLFLILSFFIRLLCLMTKNNTHFGDKLILIPEEDVLVLQVKGKKHQAGKEPIFTDFYVHPQNDMRHFLKEGRHKNKVILKIARQYCQDMASLSTFSEVKAILVELANFFEKGLILIENEKLIRNNPLSSPTDLHTTHLYELMTRNGLPLSDFLRGFFLPPFTPCNDSLAALPFYTSTAIAIRLQKAMPHVDTEEVEKSAQLLSAFLWELKNNEGYIATMGNRLSSTLLGDINGPLQLLLKSRLFSTLVKIKEETSYSPRFYAPKPIEKKGGVENFFSLARLAH